MDLITSLNRPYLYGRWLFSDAPAAKAGCGATPVEGKIAAVLPDNAIGGALERACVVVADGLVAGLDEDESLDMANSVLTGAGMPELLSRRALDVASLVHGLDVTVESNASCFFRELLVATGLEQARN